MSTGIDTATHGGYPNQEGSPPVVPVMFADRWWTLVIRGIAAIGFGIFAVVAPRTSLLAIVYIFGAYAVVDGLVHLLGANRSPRDSRAWLVFEGLVSIGAGLVAMFWTDLTAYFLVMLIASWAALTGIAELAAAVSLRRKLHGEWLLATSGVLSIVLAIVLFFSPEAGIVALLWMIGGYAIIFGLILVALGFRLRSWRSDRSSRIGTSSSATGTGTGASPVPG